MSESFGFTATKVMAPTMGLRFVERHKDTRGEHFSIPPKVRVLQQAWRDQFSGDVEWRDVPLVDEGAAP